MSDHVHPEDLRALMAALVWANAECNAGLVGVVRETDALLAELQRTAQPVGAIDELEADMDRKEEK